MNQLPTGTRVARWAVYGVWITVGVAQAQPSPTAQTRPGTERNQSSQRYEINQTFDGQAFFKDNNVWVYTKEFADLFGMPAKHIEETARLASSVETAKDPSKVRRTKD